MIRFGVHILTLYIFLGLKKIHACCREFVLSVYKEKNDITYNLAISLIFWRYFFSVFFPCVDGDSNRPCQFSRGCLLYPGTSKPSWHDQEVSPLYLSSLYGEKTRTFNHQSKGSFLGTAAFVGAKFRKPGAKPVQCRRHCREGGRDSNQARKYGGLNTHHCRKHKSHYHGHCHSGKSFSERRLRSKGSSLPGGAAGAMQLHSCLPLMSCHTFCWQPPPANLWDTLGFCWGMSKWGVWVRMVLTAPLALGSIPTIKQSKYSLVCSKHIIGYLQQEYQRGCCHIVYLTIWPCSEWSYHWK